MSGKEKSDLDCATPSTWELRRHTDQSFFFDYSESAILSDFGWNIPPESNAACSSFADLPPIEPDSSESRAVVESDTIGNTIEPTVEASPSISSSSSEEKPEKRSASAAADPPADAAGKTKKKGQKRIRQPRFAFVTKSEVDHLEDGYRWRKYGQKAVKNSPFPRSYYRCTNSKCIVKKRIERSWEDPSVVITTYEGQHCHFSVGYQRGGEETAFPRYLAPSNKSHLHLLYHPPPPLPNSATLHGGSGVPRAAVEAPSFEGLLGDIVSPRMRNIG